MRNALNIAWRDIRSVFVSPIAYVVLTGFVLLAGWFFFNLLGQFNRYVATYSSMQGYDTSWLNLNDAVLAPLVQNLAVVLLIVIPMVTMRSFAEERSVGTYELLFTSPVRIAEIVIGKFLAGAFLVTVMVGLSLMYPAILMWFGNPEPGLIFSGYLGLWLTALSFVAIGNFTSSLTSNQIIAAVGGIVVLLLLFVINWAAEGAAEPLRSALLHVSVTENLTSLVRGVIDTRNLIYFASLIAVALFLTHRAVESARWR